MFRFEKKLIATFLIGKKILWFIGHIMYKQVEELIMNFDTQNNRKWILFLIWNFINERKKFLDWWLINKNKNMKSTKSIKSGILPYRSTLPGNCLCVYSSQRLTSNRAIFCFPIFCQNCNLVKRHLRFTSTKKHYLIALPIRCGWIRD